MLKSINGIIQSCVPFRTGEKNGRKWTIFNVVINGEKFSTFDTKYSQHIGTEGTWEYEEKQNGQYVNRTLSRYPEAKTPNANADESIMRAFGIIRGDIKALKDLMESRFLTIQDMINSITIEDMGPESEESQPPQIQYDETLKNTGDLDIPVIEDTVI
jgi:hypothetical protein